MACRLLAVLALLAAALVAAKDEIGTLRKEVAELRTQLGRLEEESRQKQAASRAEVEALEAEARSLSSANETGVTAALEEKVGELAFGMDSMWLVLCGALVMFMHNGFAMLETGCCRAKNASNVLMKNLVNVCVGTIGWYLFGYALAYGGPYDVEGALENQFIGFDQFAAKGFLESDDDGNLTLVDGNNHMLAWFFQWAFCTAAATIVSGAVAERVLSPTYAAYAFVMSAFIYPVVVAWTWGYGWLAYALDVGYIDFAGSGIVHLCGGVSGLAGTIVLGPRKGRFERPEDFEPHNLPLVVLGTLSLWFGWYGFNCGSTLGIASAERGAMAAQVAMNTTIAAATGGVVVFFLRYVITKLYDVGGLCNGILAGLVSITAPCGNVEAGSAFAIGLIGACIYQGASMALQKLKIDDPVDAVPVHGACGIWGVLAAALFDWGNGFDHFHGWSGFSCMTNEDGSCQEGIWGKVFAVQIILILAVTAWSGVFSGATFFVLKMTRYLRIDEATEDIGLDAAKHSPGKAYAMGSPEQQTTKPI